jgi:hypothetical protein
LPRGTAICVAESYAAAAYLRALAGAWSAVPPAFDWHFVRPERIPVTALELPVREGMSGAVLSRAAAGFGAAGPKVCLCSASGLPSEFDILDAAQAAGVPVFQFVDTWYNYRRRVERNGRLVLGDRMLVIDGRAVTEAADEGIPRDRLVAVGHPVWQHVRPLPPPRARGLLFVGAPIEREYGRSLGYTERDCWNMLKAALDALPGLFDEICYAPHPDDRDALKVDGVRIVGYRPELLETVDTVAGMFSAPLIDAFLSGRRAVSVQPGAIGYDMCPLSRHGRIPRATTVDALIGALQAPPSDPAALAASFTGSDRRIAAEIEKALEA